VVFLDKRQHAHLSALRNRITRKEGGQSNPWGQERILKLLVRAGKRSTPPPRQGVNVGENALYLWS